VYLTRGGCLKILRDQIRTRAGPIREPDGVVTRVKGFFDDYPRDDESQASFSSLPKQTQRTRV
jgi:hypothetical protein